MYLFWVNQQKKGSDELFFDFFFRVISWKNKPAKHFLCTKTPSISNMYLIWWLFEILKFTKIWSFDFSIFDHFGSVLRYFPNMHFSTNLQTLVNFIKSNLYRKNIIFEIWRPLTCRKWMAGLIFRYLEPAEKNLIFSISLPYFW